jgi:hypothetical protein
MQQLLSLVALCFLLAGCGTPGAPQPPSLELPKPVEDLRAVRRGNVVQLAWTMPSETTDGQGIRGPISVRVCRAFRTQMNEGCKSIAKDIPFSAQIARESNKQTFTDDLTPVLNEPHGMDFVNYNVEVLNSRGRSAGPSNLQTIFLAPAVPAPRSFMASVAADAVVLQWQAANAPESPTLRTEYSYRVLRSSQGQSVGTVAELPITAAEYRDTNFDWDKPYTYQIVGVTKVLAREDGRELAQFVGAPSEPVTITAKDTFAPTTPEGLQAVFAGAVDPNQNFIDLTWTPNVESDLAGYNIYRAANGAAPIKINSTAAPTPSFRDDQIASGTTYTYSVSAVDARGNESSRSQAVTEPVPAKK